MRHGFRHTRSQRWRRHASAKTIGTIPRKNEERYNMRNGLFHLATGATLAIALSASSAYAQKKYDTGASDTEIKIGQTLAFSGPASAYATIGKTQAAYIKMINDQGGINGRKINLIQYDDAYSPPKAVEQVRKLVEDDEVLLTFQILGTPSNAAVQKYLNAKKVPQLFAATGASRFTDPKNFPWTMGFNPNYFVEGRIYGQYIIKNYPNAKVGILYQNDDLGKDYLNGIKAGLGDKAATMVVAEASYEVSDPTVDSQILKIKDAGADLFFSASTPKQAAQTIKKIAELGWHPVHILDINATSVGDVMKQASNLKNVQLDLSLPGIVVNTTPTDYRVNKQLQMMKFNGERWELFGPILEDAGPAG